MASSSPSSPGKASLTNWWKQIKHDIPNPNLLNETSTTASNNTTSTTATTSNSMGLVSSSYNNNSDSSNTTANSMLLSPSRPFLGLKSKSSNSVPGKNPFSVSLDNSSQEKLKQHRDSFLQKKNLDFFGDSEVFGVSLENSIKVAEGKICISSDNGLITYGKIPRVIAVCGIYLKKNGLDTEGIFRVAGSSRRIKQLQLIFSSPPDYGTKIDWDGYTVHDAASLFRRFLASLPEPLIPFSFYQAFRGPLINRPIITKYLNDRKTKYLKKQAARIYAPRASETVPPEQSQPVPVSTETDPSENVSPTSIVITKDTSAVEGKDDGNENEMAEFENDENKNEAAAEEGEGEDNNENSTRQRKKKSNKEKFKKERREALKEYAELFDKLPALEKQLLFYVLDLLATFDIHSAKNLMPARNLAAIFQPSILYHPDHDMSPDEYALSSLVIEFMIENSYKILPAAANTSSSSIVASTSKDDLIAPQLISTESSSTLSTKISSTVSTTTGPTAGPSATQSQNSKLPSSTTYLQRKHSKSLSSVLSPPDMVRIQSKKKLDSMVVTPRGSITGEDINTDSAVEVDTEEDIDNVSSRRRSSSILNHQLHKPISKSQVEGGEFNILPPNPSFSPKKFSPQHVNNGNASSNLSLTLTLNSSNQQGGVGTTSATLPSPDQTNDLDEQIRYLTTSDPQTQTQTQSQSQSQSPSQGIPLLNRQDSVPRQSRSTNPIDAEDDELITIPRAIEIPNSVSSPSNKNLLNLPSPKKSGNWFSRLRSRSRSRSSSKHNSNPLEITSPPDLSPTGTSFPR